MVLATYSIFFFFLGWKLLQIGLLAQKIRILKHKTDQLVNREQTLNRSSKIVKIGGTTSKNWELDIFWFFDGSSF